MKENKKVKGELSEAKISKLRDSNEQETIQLRRQIEGFLKDRLTLDNENGLLRKKLKELEHNKTESSSLERPFESRSVNKQAKDSTLLTIQ